MEFEDLSPSGIERLANYSPYLDQLAGLANEMGLRQRSNLVHLERCLHQEWSLGANNVLSWCPLDEGILVLVVPHYAIAEYTASPQDEPQLPQKVSAQFITELISGDRQLTLSQMQKVSRLLDVEPKYIPLRQPLSGNEIETQIIEKMIKRYGINFVANRAVTLFDIVGFSLLTPFEQMTQLNSLSYSLNSAHAKMLELEVAIKLLFERYPENVLGFLSDIRFPRGGTEDPRAGFELVRAVRERVPDVPFLLLSAEPENAAQAYVLRTSFLDKNAPDLVNRVRRFIKLQLGFGEFVFRTPDGIEEGRRAPPTRPCGSSHARR